MRFAIHKSKRGLTISLAIIARARGQIGGESFADTFVSIPFARARLNSDTVYTVVWKKETRLQSFTWHPTTAENRNSFALDNRGRVSPLGACEPNSMDNRVYAHAYKYNTP